MLRPEVFLVGVILALPAQGQTVVGRVTDRTSGTAVAGVVVSAQDSSGTLLARTVTDSASGYRMPVLAGMAKLTFRRIGYSPAEALLRDTTNGRLDVIMSQVPTQLPPVKAMTMAQCDTKSNTEDVLSLWEQVRSGLLTSMVARESKAAYTSVLVYQTTFDGDDEQPRTVSRVELPPGVTNAFIAGSDPATLARDGYLVREGFALTFVGPDDNVLFDQSFLTTSCFTLAEAARDSLVGIHFEGGKGRKVVGISGTVWLRRDPLDLVSIEYTYTNLDRALQRATPGGSMQFRRMPNGITMISEWRIRSASAFIPASAPAARQTVVVGPGGRGRPAPRSRAASGARDAVARAMETGALIEVMQWPDVPPFVARLATVSGAVTDRYTKKPLANTPVRFARTPFAATTDSLGRFSMVDVLPGVYAAEAGDFELEKYGVAGDLAGPIALRYGPNEVSFEAESPQAAVVRGCSEKVDGRVDMPKALAGQHAIFGAITLDGNGLPARGQEFFVEVTPAGAVPGSQPFPLKGKVDHLGRFRVCNLPDGTVRIRASTKNGLSGASDVGLDPGHPYRLVAIRLKASAGP